jgi:hypothetical protein
MAAIDKCLAVLRTSITQDQTNGIGIAEQAINDYVASLEVSMKRPGLEDVRLVVQTYRKHATSAS